MFSSHVTSAVQHSWDQVPHKRRFGDMDPQCLCPSIKALPAVKGTHEQHRPVALQTSCKKKKILQIISCIFISHQSLGGLEPRTSAGSGLYSVQ